jgi:release factor glutamine methyltransferase
MKAIEALREVTRSLEAYGIESAWKEAEILVTHGSGMDVVEIYRDNPDIPMERVAVIQEMVSRRKRREPMPYIVGHGEFMGLKLILKEGVLIPRPETELMAEYTINMLRAEAANGRRWMILDLCTGSGCLALALAKAFPEAYVYGVDISRVAVGCAKEIYCGRSVEAPQDGRPL